MICDPRSTSPARSFSGLLYTIFMFEGPDKRKKASGIPTAFGITNRFLGVAGKVLGAAARAGTNAIADANSEQHRKLAMDDIHSIMFGRTLARGETVPTIVRNPRTHSLGADEWKRYDKAINYLRGHDFVVPGYVAAFDRHFVR